VIVELDLRAGAGGFAVLLIAVEIDRRGCRRHREEVAVAGPDAERAELAGRCGDGDAAVGTQDAADLRVVLLAGSDGFLAGQSLANLSAEQLVEQRTGAAVARNDDGRRPIRLATPVRVQRGKDTGAFAARVDIAAELLSLAFQRLEIAFHPVDLRVQGAAFAGAAEEGEAAARPARLAAGDVELIALARHGGVVLAEFRRAAAARRGQFGLELPADPGVRIGTRRRRQQAGERQRQGRAPRSSRFSCDRHPLSGFAESSARIPTGIIVDGTQTRLTVC